MAKHVGFDCYGDCSGILDGLPDEVDFAARYYSHNPNKNLSRQEAENISSYEMQIVCVWESAGDKVEFFSATQGREDATAAMALAQEIGQPEGTAIYFAVDTDVTPQGWTLNVKPYFQQVALTLAGHFKVGAYAPGSVLRELGALGLVEYFWLPNAKGWSGYQGALNSGKVHVLQGSTGDPWGTGTQIDTDEAQFDDYGQWSLPQAATTS